MHLKLAFHIARSEFDFANIVAAAKKVNKTARVLLRINPNVDPQVGVDPISTAD